MGLLLKLLLGGSEKGKKAKPKPERSKRDIRLEREMDAYGLLEEERKLVRTGKYDPWSFEEDEMDEDDYYYDDT